MSEDIILLQLRWLAQAWRELPPISDPAREPALRRLRLLAGIIDLSEAQARLCHG